MTDPKMRQRDLRHNADKTVRSSVDLDALASNLKDALSAEDRQALIEDLLTYESRPPTPGEVVDLGTKTLPNDGWIDPRIHNQSRPDPGNWTLEIKASAGAHETQRFFASLPFRDVVGEGATVEEAAGDLLRAYARLAYYGSLDPEAPNDVGAPPLQHVMNILQRLLQKRLLQRFEDWRDRSIDAHAEAGFPEATAGSNWTKDPIFARTNEVLSGIATAIAALARIKEL